MKRTKIKQKEAGFGPFKKSYYKKTEKNNEKPLFLY